MNTANATATAKYRLTIDQILVSKCKSMGKEKQSKIY